MRFNKRDHCIRALYRLFCVCYMLRSVKAVGLTLAHDYPKRQLSYMLLLAYWQKTGHVTYSIMDGNMNLFNEEYGEIFFSTLSRCVLGDHIKADFDHMNNIYKLLSVYRDVKNDMLQEHSGSSRSINWHHNIPSDSEDVAATAFWFRRVITQICNGTYKSYTRKSKYGTQLKELESLSISYTPLVFSDNILNDIDGLYDRISHDICANWVTKYTDQWDSEVAPIENVNDMVLDEKHNSESDASVVSDGDDTLGPPWVECIEGWFAVTSDSYGGNKGICVYKVIDKHPLPVNSSESYGTFEGKEWICTKDNTRVECVKHGKWNWHPVRSNIQTVYNWCVISYFENFDARKLPIIVVRKILDIHSRQNIF